MLDAITSYFAGLEPGWLFFALFVCSYIENIFPPVPGDTVTVFAAYLVGRSNHDALGIMLATSAGSSAGFMTYYALGRLIPGDFFARKNYRVFPAASFERAGKWFRRYGYWVILLNRFFSGVRSVISLVTGMYRLPWLPVFALSGLGCALWNGLLIWAGYQLGVNWKQVERFMTQYNKGLLALAIAAAAIWLIRKRMVQKRKGSGVSAPGE